MVTSGEALACHLTLTEIDGVRDDAGSFVGAHQVQCDAARRDTMGHADAAVEQARPPRHEA